MAHTVEQNMVLSTLGQVSRGLVYSNRRARRSVDEMVDALGIRTTGPGQGIGQLSGGNQQKVVLAKALLADPRIFLLDEPTFGVDVRTAAEIIRRVRSEVEGGGRAAIWVSSDFSELVNVADRILVLADGTLKTIVRRDSKGHTEDALLTAIQPSSGPTGRQIDVGPGAAV
jgi:ABC-type sugar transport system ATPase subunit